MWEPLLSPGSDGNSDQIKDRSWVICLLRSHLFITAEGEYHICSRSLMEGTVMTPEVCHQQVWMTCHLGTYYPSDCRLHNWLNSHIYLRVFTHRYHDIILCVNACVFLFFTAAVTLLLFWYQRPGPPLTFNYRELQLICVVQGVKLTEKAFHCINVKYVQICKQIKQIHSASVSLTQSSNFKAIVVNVMVFSTIVRTPNIKHLQKKVCI